MQDKNFDNILKNHLSSTQSFDHQEEDWAAMSEQLDILMPQKKRRFSAIWLLTAGLLLTSSITFYTLHKLDIIGSQLKDIKTSVEEKQQTIPNQPIASTDTDLEEGEANVRLSLSDHQLKTNTSILETSNLGKIQSSNPLVGNQTTTRLSLTNVPSFIGNSIAAKTTIKLPTNSSINTNNTTISVVENVVNNPSIDKEENTIEANEQKVVSESKEVKATNQPIVPIVEEKEEKEDKEEIPYAFLHPIQEEIDILKTNPLYAAKEEAKTSTPVNNNKVVSNHSPKVSTTKVLDHQEENQSSQTEGNKFKILIENVLDGITPESYIVAATVTRGISPLEFENKDDIFEGGFSYGAKFEILFNDYLRMYGALGHLHQQLVYHGAESTSPILAVETPADHFLDKTLLSQSFLQGTIGLKATMDLLQSDRLTLHAGIGIPAQLRLRENYEYAFKHISEDNVIKASHIEGSGNIKFSSFNFNSGVEYDLTDKVSLQLEGNYNLQTSDNNDNYLPDVFSLSFGIAYNWGNRS